MFLLGILIQLFRMINWLYTIYIIYGFWYDIEIMKKNGFMVFGIINI